MCALTWKPYPGSGPALNSPPSRLSRSRIPDDAVPASADAHRGQDGPAGQGRAVAGQGQAGPVLGHPGSGHRGQARAVVRHLEDQLVLAVADQYPA